MAQLHPESVRAYGSRLLSQTLSSLAKSDPDRDYASIPKTRDPEDGFITIPFHDMERIANATATWIEDMWGPSLDFEAIAYIGVPDLRSAVVFFAAIRNGYNVCLPLDAI